MCKSFNFSLLPTRIYADKAGNGMEMEMKGEMEMAKAAPLPLCQL